MAAAAKARVAVLEAALAAQSEVCAALSDEFKALRFAGLHVASALPSRARAPGTRSMAASAAPASTLVPVCSATKVLVASSCPKIINKEDGLAHAVQAVCLVGAFRGAHCGMCPSRHPHCGACGLRKLIFHALNTLCKVCLQIVKLLREHRKLFNNTPTVVNNPVGGAKLHGC
jgi:hypothetical protein